MNDATTVRIFDRRGVAYKIGDWEHEETKAVSELLRPGDLFVDVGAHVGYYSCLALSLGAKVIAFEPNPDLFNLLLRNAQENGYGLEIQAFMWAVSNSSGDERFFLSPDDMLSSLAGGDSGMGSIIVKTERLDEGLETIERMEERRGFVPIRKYRLLKTDTEGAEFLVLDGLGERARDVEYVLVEVQDIRLKHFGVTEEDVRAKLRSMGFELERAFQTQNELWKNSSAVSR